MIEHCTNTVTELNLSEYAIAQERFPVHASIRGAQRVFRIFRAQARVAIMRKEIAGAPATKGARSRARRGLSAKEGAGGDERALTQDERVYVATTGGPGEGLGRTEQRDMKVATE